MRYHIVSSNGIKRILGGQYKDNKNSSNNATIAAIEQQKQQQ